MPASERYGAQYVSKAIRVTTSSVALTYMAPDTAPRMPFVTLERNIKISCCPLSNTACEPSGMLLMSGGITNLLPSIEQLGGQTVKDFDQWKYAQSAAIH